jgi:hypothetical protein
MYRPKTILRGIGGWRTLSFLAVNDAAVECYGYPREELLAMTVRQLHLLAERSSQLDQELRSPIFSAPKRTWRICRFRGDLCLRHQVVSTCVYMSAEEAQFPNRRSAKFGGNEALY